MLAFLETPSYSPLYLKTGGREGGKDLMWNGQAMTQMLP